MLPPQQHQEFARRDDRDAEPLGASEVLSIVRDDDFATGGNRQF